MVRRLHGCLKEHSQGVFNYLITESEVVSSDSEVNTVGRGLRFSRNDRTVEVIKLFIIWLTKRFKRKKEKTKFKGKSFFTSGDVRTYLCIHSSFQTLKLINEFSELKARLHRRFLSR